ncbi:MAG: hypothetical protein D6754_04705 [Alphaproteobacteria bacterium]|nr:MAG: hypothetical protein D6754_04705 [Alphaproteobacteria bacterium]
MRLLAFLVALIIAPPVIAQDFAAESRAKSWNLLGEEKARFAARVVDILCELTGDCPANCGGGTRQLGLLRKADGKLVLPLKNGQPLFTGAATDLAPYCGAEVEVDGLLVGDDDMTPVKFYQVQLIRRAGESEWHKANRWTREWAKANPDLPGKGPWFRRDPRIKARIAASGYLGLGPEADKALIEELFGE